MNKKQYNESVEMDCGVDEIGSHEVLRGPLVGTVQILVQYRVNFSTALDPQLQLWHLRWLVSVQFTGDLPSCVPYKFLVVYRDC
jgi:hypothetical protein